MRVGRINHALVEVDIEQKEGIRFKGEGGRDFVLYRPTKYTENGRESANVMCKVIDIDSKEFSYLKNGDTLLVHHNFFTEGNGYFVTKDIETKKAVFCIPVSRNIFAKVLSDGSVEPVCENMIVERLFEEAPSSIIIVPESFKKTHKDRFKVISASIECLKKGINVGDTVLTYVKSDYEICYNWGSEDRSVVKVWMEDVFGKLTL